MHAKFLIATAWIAAFVVLSNDSQVDAQHTWTPRVEAALKLAGDHRVELETLLVDYAHNLDNLFFQNGDAEGIPKWLAGRIYRDVTDQYMATTDVSIKLTEPAPKSARFAYICVFNGGQWQPIHWCQIEDKQATFRKMGSNIVYLAGYFVDEKIVPAAPPFILNAKGEMSQLSADFDRLDQWRLSKITPTIKDDDLKTELPAENTVAGATYEIMVWNDGWQSLGKHVVDPKDPAVVGRLPAGGLYWMVSDTNRQTARPFTIENDKPRFW